MNKILRWFLPVAVCAVSLVSCAKAELGEFSDFRAEWATAYYMGGGEGANVNAYLLDLVQGRTDDNLELISSGAVVRLWINSPGSGDISLPVGFFRGSATRDQAYTFHCDGAAADGDVRCSYLVLRSEGGSRSQEYPLESGNLTVQSKDGAYSLSVRVRTAEREFTFSYEGDISTIDCTKSVNNNLPY